jgi:hypothetical protein
MCRPSLFAGCFLTALTAFGPQARGEVFVLKSGGRIEGEHVNRDRQPGQPYQVLTVDGVKLALADSVVQRMIVKTDLDEQYEVLVRTLANTPEAHWNMAEWCKEAGLAEQRKRHLQAVINLDPNHTEARKALGYQRYGTRWLTQDEHMQSQGYMRYKGTWRLKQEIEIDSRELNDELATKKLRKDIRMWLEQVATGGRLADTADRNLNAVSQPEAAPALADVLGDPQQPRAIRERCLTILSRLPPGLATRTLARIAMNDPDDRLRDACLEELKRQGTHLVLPAFIAELKSKDNARVNRAADCLNVLGDKDATLPLISALITEHQFKVQQGGGPPGSMTTTFSPNGGPGGGGLSMGGKPQIIKKKLQNPSVRDALATLYPGINHQYDIDAWRVWYTESQTTSKVDLRRGD